ncbi:ABC transporter permease [Oerskovia jenensis]|uniref:ABC transporter permease n=1 Tax=Oerskovia jenensis TaxID=162169 RepID=UPI0036D8B36B
MSIDLGGEIPVAEGSGRLVPAREEGALAPSPATGDGTAPRARRGSVSPSFVAGLVMVGLVALVGVVAIFWTPYDVSAGAAGTGGRLEGSSAQFWAGTDRLGRDLLSQLMGGATVAMTVAIASVVIAGVLGLAIGVVAAATTRWADVALLNVIDLMIAFPTLLLAMLVVTVRGASLTSAIVAIGISGAAVIARVTRVNAARVLREDYVTAATASGTGWWGTILRHVLPNVAPTLLVQLMLLAGGAILAEASLSYLGLGSPTALSWGRLLSAAQKSVAVQPLGAILPGLLIAWTVLGLNLLGDGIRERTDPSLRGDR